MYKRIYASMNIMVLFTLIITTIMIMSACYTNFDEHLRNEVKDRAIMLSSLCNEAENQVEVLKALKDEKSNTQVALFSGGRETLFATDDSIAEYDKNINEFKTALAGRVGESIKLIAPFGTSECSYSIMLDNGYVLRVGVKLNSPINILMSVLLPVVLIICLMYLLCLVVAGKLTESIVKPIESIDPASGNYEGVYKELMPFLKRISGQSYEIKHQAERVERQRSRLQAVGESMNEGLIVLDRYGNITYSNKGADAILSLSPGQQLPFAPIAESFGFDKSVENAYSGEKSTQIITVDDNSYRVFFSPVFENDSVISVILLLFDVSEEMRGEKIRREFSANVSHELKTPLTTVLGYSQIINNGLAKPEDVKRFTGKIEKETSRLITLIDDIIKLSELDEHIETDDRQEVSLRSVALEVKELLDSRAERRSIAIKIGDGDFEIFADPAQMTELIYNLCDNAIKYNKDGGCVKVEFTEKGFKVSDNGIGISQEDTTRIFERFYRVDKSRSKTVNGTGLGLSIVKHIAILSGAEITVESKIGEGSTFTVTFK